MARFRMQMAQGLTIAALLGVAPPMAAAAGWKLEPMRTNTAHGPGNFYGVSCLTSDACVATSNNAVDRWNGHQWTAQHTPKPPGASELSLNGVDCVSLAFCEVVGGASGTGSAGALLAEQSNGTSWTPQAVPATVQNVQSGNGPLFGVSCPTVSLCLAVGGAVTTARTFQRIAVADLWDGTAWTAEALPLPARAYFSELDGISCATTTRCVAVGTYSRSGQNPEGGAGLPYAVTWNGFAWSLDADTANRGGSLESISCPTATTCMAVGTRAIGKDNVPLASRWDNGRWSATAVRNVAYSPTTVLLAVSCASANRCAAAGIDGYGGELFGSQGPLIEAWNGRAWHVQQNPFPPGPPEVTLSGTSCYATGCTIVGWNDDYSAVAEKETF